MLIEDIVDITEGTLLNSPFISSVGKICIDCECVKRGDLFVALNEEDIEIAIKNGAYGILTSSNQEILDKEIAWIKTDDLDRALRRLIKYFFIEKEYNFILLNDLQFNIIIDNINTNKKDYKHIAILNHDIRDNFNVLMDDKKNIFFTKDEVFLDILNVSFFHYNNFILPKYEITHSSIFDTKFVYNGSLEYIRISNLFFVYFIKLFHFLNDFGVSIEIKDINIRNNFMPYFLDNQGNLLEFGKSSRVLISENDSSLLNEEIQYLLETIKWIKLSIFIDIKNKIAIDKRYEKNISFYQDEKELIEKIKKELSGYIFIDKINFDILNNIKPQEKERSLFNEF